MSRIISFTGKNHFLSNFYMSEVAYEGRVYPSSEHAFVAAKTTDDEIRKHVATLPTPGQVKRYGRSIQLREGWDDIRINEMRKILENKFGDQELWEKLQATRPHELIEGNDWGDRFWGESPLGNGRNELGKLLMAIRDDITRIE